MANAWDSRSPHAVAAKREPMFLPGFDRPTQLGMEFNTIKFGTAWLRKQYTKEHTRSIQACLATEKHYRHERRLQEVRYGNNITLLFKACYTFKSFYGSGALWDAISRVFGVSSNVAESVADLFIEARAIHISNHPPGSHNFKLRTTATYWVDRWTFYLDNQAPEEPPPDYDVFAAVDYFFIQETGKNGDLSRILSAPAEIDVDPPTRPPALRKRSPSPSALESAPNAKKRTISTSVAWTRPQATSPDVKGEEERHDPVHSTSGRERPDYQLGRKDQGEPYFALKPHGRAQWKVRNSPTHQDHHGPEADDYETLVQSNVELQHRVELLEKERLESTEAQKDRDNAIRALQARFTAFEKSSAAADTHSSVNDKLVREMQEMAEKLNTQTEKLQTMEKQLELGEQTSKSMKARFTAFEKWSAVADTHSSVNDKVVREMAKKLNTQTEKLQTMEKQLELGEQTSQSMQARFTAFQKISAAADTHSSVNDKLVREMAEKLGIQAERLQKMENQIELSEQASQSMQATISSMQEDSATVTETNTRQEGSLETQKRESSEMLVRIASLEAKSVFHNDMHKIVREIKAEVAAQKDKAAAATPDSTNEPNEQDISTRLRATEEATERQAQTLQEAMERVAILESQELARNARIASLESRPETAQDIFRLKSRLSVLDQSQANNVRELDRRLAIMQKSFEQMQGDIKEASERLAKLGNLQLVQFLVPEMQTKIAHIEIRGTEISKRLDDVEVAQDELTLKDQSSRIDALSKTVEALKSLPLSLARADNARVEALRNELIAFSEKQIVASQPMNQKMDAATTSMFQGLSSGLERLDHMCVKHMAECQQRFDQVFGGAGNIVWDGKQNSVSAVVDSLCQRVSIMENGFQVMTDFISRRRR